MAALTHEAPRYFTGERTTESYPVAAGQTIYAGAAVVVEVTGANAGYAFPAGDRATACKTVGVAQQTVVNSGGANGAARVLASKSTGRLGPFLPDATNPVTQSHVGRVVFWTSDQEVGHTSVNKRQAGEVIAVGEDGIYLDMKATAIVATA